MRRTRVLVAIISVLALGSLLPAGAVIDADAAYPAPGVSVTSDNVEHVGYLPEAGPSVSARVVEVEGQRRFYVSSIKGFSIYDIDDPASPLLMGFLPVAGFQNEDMAVSDDGELALLAFGDANLNNFLIDASDPTLPTLHATFGGPLAGETGLGDHTLECANPGCTHAYGSGGNTYHIRNDDGSLADGSIVGSWREVIEDQLADFEGGDFGSSFSQTAHKVVRDAVGLVNTDTVPRVMFDPREDPVNPELITVGLTAQERAMEQLQYQHNNLRPRAETWEPREEDELDDPGLRDGELLLITGETNLRTSCSETVGPFGTMSVANFDRGEPMEVLDTFRPLDNGDYLDGNPAVNALGCSGHWFDWLDDPATDELIVSAAWFEHGVRFLEVEAATGAINEVGFFQPVNGSAGATYWIEHEGELFVYTTDYVRGIDILRFDSDPELRPSQDELDANWLSSLHRPTLPATVVEQRICRLAIEG